MAYGPPVIARPASTVVLVRENNSGCEVFLTKRPDTMAFLGGYYVFPGGRVDATDLSPEATGRLYGAPPGGIEVVSEDGHNPVGFVTAAIRELYEEAGVLLLCDDEGSFVSSDIYHRLREHPIKDVQSFVDEVVREGLYYASHRLSFLQRFVTPSFSPMRFYTVFLQATLPEGQEAGVENREVDRSLWITPEEALLKNRSGEFPMIPPTLIALRMLIGGGQ